ncbi:MAG: glycogen-binding domain-containing protein [Candidatus Hydrothermales bacterium]
MKLFILILIFYPVKFRIKAPDARIVLLAGDFTNWEKGALKMEKKGDFWEIEVDLEPGRYEYKFIVDGNWVNDPENPLKVGVFGNSLIEVTEKGEKIIPLTLSNTDWNRSVNFSGDIRFYLRFEDTLRKILTIGDSKLDIKGFLPYNSMLWLRLRYQNRNIQSDGSIPIFFERAEFSLREGNLSLRGFYNKFVLSSIEPFDLIGNIGEFHKDFGREEEGFILNYKSKTFDLDFLYSNGWKEGRDLIFSRFRFFKISALNYFKSKGFDRVYGSASPDSLTLDNKLVLFNSYKDENFVSIDLNKKIGSFELNFASGRGELFWKADEKSSGEPFKHSLKLTDFLRFYGSFIYSSRFKSGLSLEYDINDFKKFSGNYRGGLFISSFFLKSEYINFNLKHYYFDVKKEAPFSNLFYFHRMSQLMYFETFSLGFKELLSIIFEVKPLLVPISIAARFSTSGFFYSPIATELIIKLTKKFLRNYELYSDLRFIALDAPHLRIRNSFIAPYFELRRMIQEKNFFFISYGLDPFTLDDDEWARRIFLIEKGSNLELMKNSHLRYSRVSLESEKILSELVLLTVGIEYRF